MPLLSFFDPCTYPSTSLRMTARKYPRFGEVQEVCFPPLASLACAHIVGCRLAGVSVSLVPNYTRASALENKYSPRHFLLYTTHWFILCPSRPLVAVASQFCLLHCYNVTVLFLLRAAQGVAGVHIRRLQTVKELVGSIVIGKKK